MTTFQERREPFLRRYLETYLAVSRGERTIREIASAEGADTGLVQLWCRKGERLYAVRLASERAIADVQHKLGMGTVSFKIFIIPAYTAEETWTPERQFYEDNSPAVEHPATLRVPPCSHMQKSRTR